MKQCKKFGALLLAALMSVSLAACGGQSGSGSAAQSSAGSASASSAPAADTSASATADGSGSAGGNTLVVYFSATGTTARVAQEIADAAGADQFELIPAEPYTADDLNWSDSSSRVSREHDDESLRDVPLTQTTPENWDDYDTVFLGYPIWWGGAAWPVDHFVKDNDFTGKTVIPFATSASSGMGQSGALLAELAGTGDWQEGQRFSGGASQSDVTDWVNSLGLAG